MCCSPSALTRRTFLHTDVSSVSGRSPARLRFTCDSRFRKLWASHGEERRICLWCARRSSCSRDIPPSLGGSDCELLREIKGALLAVLPVQIVSYRLACEAPGRALPPFRISVSAWAPVHTTRLAAGAPGTLAGVAMRKDPPR